jgi:Ca2+/Na+ antiporter
MFAAIDGPALSGIKLMAAAALLYGGSRLAVFALARPDGSDAGRRAIGQWLPIAATAIAAIVARRADIAVAVIFGSSVALLSLVLGMALYMSPLQSLPASKKVWPFVLPAALLPLMAGFSAHLTWWHALMFLALGAGIFSVWRESIEAPEESSEPRPPMGVAVAIMFVAITITCIGSVFAVAGAITRGAVSHLMPGGTLAATVVSALLVLPTLGTASMVAQRGHPGRAVTALVGSVLLNLCLLLPVTVLLWYPLSTAPQGIASFREFFVPWESAHAMPYDLVAWRIETVVVAMLGFGLIPTSMGRVTIGRLESVLLVVGYAVYVLAVAMLGLQIV